MQLKAPAFVSAARAEGEATDSFISDKLDAEAGMSAYFKSTTPINLNLVAGALRTIEIQNADYIIGSVDVPNYPEDFDAHIYAHKDGWLLAYNKRSDAPSKIIDTRGKTIHISILESALSVVAGAAGIPFSSATHYDFRYPDAEKILYVAEDYGDGNCFDITLPSSYGYFDRSWAVFSKDGNNGNLYFSIDGINATITGQNRDYYIRYGTIAASQLLTDTPHQICVDSHSADSGWGVLMILYQEP